MERQEQIDFGERLLIWGVLSVLVVEAFFTILSLTLYPNLPRLALSVLGGVLILVLGAWLYTGDRRAWQAAVGWSGLELVLSAIPLVWLLLRPARASSEPLVLALSVPEAWLAAIKFLVYLGFFLMLTISVNVSAFLAARHGEPATAPTATPAAAAPLTLTEQQASLLQSLAGTFQAVGLLAVLAGAGLIVWETTSAPLQTGPNLLILLEGLVLLILGVVLLLPPGALAGASQPEPTSADVAAVFRRLNWLCVGVLLGGLLFLAAALVNLRPLYS